MVGHAIQSILSLALLILVGFFLETREWFEGGSVIFSKYCTNFSIPCYMVYNLITVAPSRAILLEIAANLPVPLVVMLAGTAMAAMLAKLFRVTPGRRGIFVIAGSFSNTVFIGFPVVQGIYGEEGLPIAMVYYMMSLILFWTMGIYIMGRDSENPVSFFSKEGLRKIFFAPPMLGLGLGILLVVSGVELPEFVVSALDRVQSTTTPMAMIFIGCVIYHIRFRELNLSKDILLAMLMKFIGLPAVMWAVCAMLPIPLLYKQVFFSMSALPTMTQVGLLAKECGSDYQFASLVVSLTTVTSIVVIPVYAWIIERFVVFY